MRVCVQRDDFDTAAEVETLRRASGNIGAVVTFTGVVRGADDLSSLTLEHYPGMTEREIERHIALAQARWPILGATVIHRIGELRPGENIVLVATAAEHRRAAFEAAEFLMDYLKTRAPFWKWEQRGGVSGWVGARKSDEAALTRWRED
jgi:molybdopterin synthase catalytic subunit